MSNVNITKSGPGDALDNFPGAGLQDYTDATREFKPANERPDWRVALVLGVLAIGGALVFWGAFGVWKALYCWQAINWARCDAINRAEPLVVALLLAGAAALAFGRIALRAYGELRLALARAARIATTFNRWGDPQRVDVLLPLVEEVRRYQLATDLKRATAPYEINHSINTYSPTFQAPKDAPALPEPAPAAALVPLDEWLAWVNDPDGEPHLMISGKTKAGKSTLAGALLARRVARGDAVYIIDPHYAPINRYGEVPWCGLPGVGGASWDEVRSALGAVRAEYERRKAAANRGEMPAGGFPPLTVVVDEAPEIRDNLKEEWEAFSGVMGSGARKYSIYLIVITQSHLIKDIGGSTAKRENFTIIALNEKAKALILAEVTDADEKAALLEGLRGEAWSAAIAYRAEVKLLDRRDIQRHVPDQLDAEVWAPPRPTVVRDIPLEQRAQVLLRLLGGNRDAVARRLLAQTGDRVRGGWRWEVKEVARALGMRDEDVSAIGRPGGTRSAA